MDNLSLDMLFSALADPTRRGIIERLTHGPQSVKTLSEPYDMALPSFMKHLKVMEEGGIIFTRKEGRVRTCWLEPNALIPLQGWLEWQRQAMDTAPRR